MSTSNEVQWQSQTERRRRITKLIMLVLIAFTVLLVALWFWITQPLFSGFTPLATTSADPARLEAHVRMFSTQLHPRDESHPENLDRAAAYISAEFQRAKGVVSEQPYVVNRKTYRNVIAWFGPETTQRIIVGAHYDTAGPFPGADDNASGVAGLIEIARLLSRQQLPMRVELVAFTLEEPPYFRTAHMGSAIHAASLLQQEVDVRAMFSLEMIGFFSDEPGSQKFPAPFLGAFYPSRGNFIAVVGSMGEGLLVRQVKAAMRRGSPLPVYSINSPRLVPGVDFSDQLNYWNAGYDAVMITDTAFFRNPHYHTVNDTPESLDYKRMAMVVEGVHAAVLVLAQ
jgi:Zn-dependent M28 family amino/carboxypeptidase